MAAIRQEPVHSFAQAPAKCFLDCPLAKQQHAGSLARSPALCSYSFFIGMPPVKQEQGGFSITFAV